MPLYPKAFLLTCFFIITGLIASAETFTVTTNADAGSGSLRQAIFSVNLNGISETDYIIFNIPDQTLPGRTINLQSALPAISSNVVIDGTSQPGAAIGISNAKVVLYLDHVIDNGDFTMLLIQSASNVKVYGLSFQNEELFPRIYAIRLRFCTDITIGEPGKGNHVNGPNTFVGNDYWNYYDDSVSNLRIQSNISGQPNRLSGHIYLLNAKNITIGGPTPQEGNMMFNNTITISQSPDTKAAFFAEVRNNRFNFDGMQYFYSQQAQITLYGNGLPEDPVVKTRVIDNLLYDSYAKMFLANLNHKVEVKGNKLAGKLDGTEECGLGAINIYLTPLIVIGGYTPEEENTVYGIYKNSKYGHIIHNRIIREIFSDSISTDYPWIRISSYENGLIRGKSNPNARIQLYNNLCNITSGCGIKSYHAFTNADAQGNWQFPYSAGMLPQMATATIPKPAQLSPEDSITSEFTQVKSNWWDYQVKTHPTCGKSNGSITGVKVFQGTHIQWVNSANQVISTDTNLVNVPAGVYTLKIFNGLIDCPINVAMELIDRVPPATISMYIIDATCGQNNGALNPTLYQYGMKWMNSQMDSIGSGDFMTGLAPGTYWLKLWIPSDTGCNKTYGPFVVANASGPSLNTANISITPAFCGYGSGGIQGMSIKDPVGPGYMIWVDSSGTNIANTLAVANLLPGRYRFKYKDQSSCDTLFSPWYVVPPTGLISFDLSQMTITPTTCGNNSGNIQGITASGATIFNWVNAAGNIVGTSLQLNNQPGGKYVLKMSNVYGCKAFTDSITIAVTPFINTTNLVIDAKAGTCGRKNGYIHFTNFPNPTAYTYRWADSLAPAITISTALPLNTINSGTYILSVKNSGGCEQLIKVKIAPQIPVAIQTGNPVITDEKCNNKKGGISGIDIAPGTGQSPYSYTWINASGQIVGNTASLTNAASGGYRMVAEDKNGCTDTSTVYTIGNVFQTLQRPVYLNQDVRTGTVATLTVQNHQSGNYRLYESSTSTIPLAQNTTGIFTTPVLTGDKFYYVELMDGVCKSDRVSIKITVFDNTDIYVPGAFSTTGANRILRPIAYGPIDLEYFRVYNRYGQLVFESRNFGKGWDGNFKGIPQPAGAYIWMLQALDRGNNKLIQKQGHSLLLR